MYRTFENSAVLFLILLLLSIAQSSIAQPAIKITGIVKDETNKGFSDVSLRLGLESATMTNNDGFFSIRIPAGVKDSLKISHIGYKTLIIPMAGVKEGMVINLKPVINQLTEVNITAISAEQIVKNAINHIAGNYPQLPFECHGFYREVARLDSNYLSFAEAALLILNKGYGTKKMKDSIRIVKERNLSYVGNSMVKNPFGSALKGVPYVVLDNDIVKYPGAIFGGKFLEKYNYKLVSTTMVNDEEGYIISFDQKNGIKEALYQGELVITRNGFAIVSVDFMLSSKGKQYAAPDIPVFQRPLLALLGYHFEKKDEVLSLKYYKMKDKWFPYFYSISTSHKVRARKQNINGELSIKAEMFISRISPAHHSTKSKEMPRDYSFQVLVNHYEDDYWKTFDDIRPEKSLKALINQHSTN